MSTLLEFNEFYRGLNQGSAVLIDARSPKEYLHAHIPGAFNIPLLNNEHREQVGIIYKKKGREAAVLKGFELVGPMFASLITEAIKLAPGKELYMYCWRGGMRSGILAWLFEMSGFKVSLLKGGYKSYRSVVLDELSKLRQIIILGGRTGSGKTELLQKLHETGEQIVDLELLAAHKGSAFGGLGQADQPSNEHFENLLFTEFMKSDSDQPVWLENESRSIGSVKIPDALFNQMRTALVLEVDVPLAIRRQRILDEYGSFPQEKLKECTLKLEKRLGGLRTREAVQALLSNNMSEWLDHLLVYYDEAYDYGMSLREKGRTSTVSINGNEKHSDLIPKLVNAKLEMIQKINV